MANRDGGVIVVLSGGQDSTTCLFIALQNFKRVHAITIDYGQRHRNELLAARSVIDVARKVHPDVELTAEEIYLGEGVLRGTSPLVSTEHLEQYKDWESLPGGIEKTFVPMRNQLFITLAANRAVVMDARVVMVGVSQEDYGGYPDCREPFIYALEKTINLSLEDIHAVTIVTPLMHMSKAASIHLAKTMPGCWEALAYTHTAYDGRYPPTGQDHATLLRAKGFAEAGFPDPLVVRAVKEGLMVFPQTPNYDSVRGVG